MDNNVLIIYNNPRMLAESLTVLNELEIKDYDILINKKYHNNGNKKQIENSARRLKEYINKEPIQGENNLKYTIIIRPTPTSNDELEYLYDIYPKAKYIYIEEGMGVYLKSFEDNLNPKDEKYLKSGEVYLSHPEYYEGAKRINNNEIFKMLNNRYKKDLENLPEEIKTILYTEPKEFDEHDEFYKTKIEKIIEELPKPLILKKHFRDDTKYSYGENVYELLNKIPGQLLFYKYPKSKLILTGSTTLELYVKDKSRIIKI